jgi:hypothetical protein
MRGFAALLFSSAVLLAPALAVAQDAQAPAPATAPPAATAPATTDSANTNLDEIVCKNEPPATGTRLGGGRECHTVRDWNQREKDAQDTLRKDQALGMYHSGG